jgi:hypothetical protein
MGFSQATVNPPNDWRYLTNGPYVSPGGASGATLDDILASTPANITIVVSDAQTIASRTLPVTCNLKVEKPGYIVVPNGVTLTITGNIEAGEYKIFECQGTGKVVFNKGAATNVWFRWWGATGDGTTEDTAAVQAAIDAIDTNAGGIANGSAWDIYLIETVTFNATSGSTLHKLIGNGSTLKQKTTNTVLYMDKTRYYCTIEGFNILAQAGNAGYGIYSATGEGCLVIDRCAITGFDAGFYGIYSLYNRISNSFFYLNNTAIYFIEDGTDHSNFNSIDNIRISGCKETAIILSNLNGFRAAQVAIEGSRVDVLNASGCIGVSLENFYVEGIGLDLNAAYTSVSTFTSCAGVRIALGNIAVNGGAGFHKWTSVFKIDSCQGVTIENNLIPWKNGDNTCGLYTTDGLSSGILFARNKFTEGGPTTIDVVPTAQFKDNSFTSGGWITLPVGMVEYGSMGAYNEYCTNPEFTDAITPGETGCTVTIDTGVGYGDSRSCKIAWSNVTNEATLSITDHTAGVKYGVLSFYYKADAAQVITAELHNVDSALNVPVAGDNIWRFCQYVIPGAKEWDSNTSIQFKSNLGTDNLWVDRVSLRRFDTAAEAATWMGKVRLPG